MIKHLYDRNHIETQHVKRCLSLHSVGCALGADLACCTGCWWCRLGLLHWVLVVQTWPVALGVGCADLGCCTGCWMCRLGLLHWVLVVQTWAVALGVGGADLVCCTGCWWCRLGLLHWVLDVQIWSVALGVGCAGGLSAGDSSAGDVTNSLPITRAVSANQNVTNNIPREKPDK